MSTPPETDPRKREELARILRQAAAEIQRLRRQCDDLAQYRDHTERLLALFEGGPKRQGFGEAEPDLAHMLEVVARGYETEVPE